MRVMLCVLFALTTVAGATPWHHERPDLELDVPTGFVPTPSPPGFAGLRTLHGWHNGETFLGVYQADRELSKKRSTNFDVSMRSTGTSGIISVSRLPWGKETIEVVTDAPIASPGESAQWVHAAWLPIRHAAIVIMIVGPTQDLIPQLASVVSSVKAESSWHPDSPSVLVRIAPAVITALVIGLILWRRKRRAQP